MVRPLHLPSASRRFLPSSGMLFSILALFGLMFLTSSASFGADISFNTFTADSSVAGGAMMNQAGGWMNALIRFFSSYGFIFIVIAGALFSLWGFSFGNNKVAGITGIIVAALAALYKALISYV